MGKFRNFRRFFKGKTKNKKTLIKGTFTALDVIRSNSSHTNLLAEKVKERDIPNTNIKKSISADTTERTSNVPDTLSNLNGSKNATSIAETDFESEDVDLFETNQETSSRKKVVNVNNVDIKKKAMVIAETDSESEEVEFDGEVVQKEEARNERSLPNIQTGLELPHKRLSTFNKDCELVLASVSSMVSNSHESEKKKSDSRKNENCLRNVNASRSKIFNMDAFEFQEFQTKLQPVHNESVGSSIMHTDDAKMKNALVMEINMSKYQASPNEKATIAKMCIKMKHIVLPQHQIEKSAGTRTMDEIERLRFKKYATLKLGKFDAEEDSQIKCNWKSFCQENKWSALNPKPFLYMKHQNKEFLMNNFQNRKDFVRYLAHGLPNRCLYSVYQRFKHLFSSPTKSDQYDPADDKKILLYVKQYDSGFKQINGKDQPFADLARILGRTRASVWRRYQKLKDDSN